ncbi:nucleoside recognition domain-containing protein [Rubellicoccus peritrichatus]|uniref:Nucleoside recognition domain-containing protein n=1 Tax=Rubellicoccus peritrichatus TaxID=3080537 RepID=A0AAQ3LD94_9BACT|nr:nucleoside recognition domain-containing protein [Puniceicoccus sp. CR14]WOO39904.1 nucleoside recognition domain-containing protein [Puniceicoccus sp. CR14]
MKTERTAVDARASLTASRPLVVVLGLESVGKSSLLSALSGRFAEPSALSGSTLHCERYPDSSWDWVDTPGIITGSDAVTVRDALDAMESAESILIVLRAHRASEELASLLPMLGSRKVAIVLTFQDQLKSMDKNARQELLTIWKENTGVSIALLDSRAPDATELATVRTAVMEASPLKSFKLGELPAFPKKGSSSSWARKLEQTLGFAPLSLLLLFGPAWVAVTQANALADKFYDSVRTFQAPLLSWLNQLPAPLAATLGGDYGVVAMFPFLLLYALPTILIFTGLLAIYKSTGLIDRLSYSLHPWLRPFGLGGRDLVRVVMGFGCNVPAVVATRSCSSCSRGACVSAISFGSACSYQLPATLAVFAATGFVWLGPIYLVVLALTTLLYLRATTPLALRQAQNKQLLPALGNLRPPDWGAVLRETIQSLRDFVIMALPIFIVICFAAGLLQWSGALAWLTHFLTPVMAAFHLPPEAALAVVLGSVRKDGLAIGLLNGDWDSSKVPFDTPAQVLTAVYLAGVLLPCLVTVVSVAKEMRAGFALKMVIRQACFAALFSLCIAWFGALLVSFVS